MKKLLDANNRIWDDDMVEKNNAEMITILQEEIASHI